jgi:membrane associated rhomboid family serine protease
MLEDRDYMRESSGFRLPWNLKWPLSMVLIATLIVAFALQEIDIVYFHGAYLDLLMLSPGGLRHGFIWQLLTFQFLHEGLWHLLGNCIGIFFFGRFVEQRLGNAHFLTLYFASGIAGGLLQALLATLWPMHFGGYVVGASAGVFGLIAAFALLEPEGVILIYFILPLKAKYLLYIEVAVTVFFTLVPADGIAHGAHLGGIIFTVAYIRWVVNGSRDWSDLKLFQRKKRAQRMVNAAIIRQPLAKLRRQAQSEDAKDLPSEEFISQQVDPILDKISAQGIQSLTEKERQILQAARNKMSKR